MDELEDDLFQSISREKHLSFNQDTLKSNPQPIIGIKKKVIFYDFNEDDPLADLLSDDEDFQANPSLSTARVTKGNFVSNLFGIKSTESLEAGARQGKLQPKSSLTTASEIKTDDWMGLTGTMPKKVSDETQRPMSSDILSTKDATVPSPADKTKKSSLMEDLFGSRAKLNTTIDKVIPKDSAMVGLEMSEVQKKSELLSKSNATGYAPTVSAPRDPRRGRRSSGGILDPLGMLSFHNEISGVQNSEVSVSKSDYVTSSKFKGGPNENGKSIELSTDDLPEWLGGPKQLGDSGISQAKKGVGPLNLKPRDMSLDVSQTDANAPAAVRNEGVESDGYLNAELSSHLEDPFNYSEHLSMLTGTQFDQQATMMSLQQQEHELRTAAMLSRRNEQLNKMIDSRRNRLNDQEKQFNALIRRQIERQELLEVQMKAQQDRINCHLQELMAQPTSVPITSSIIDCKELIKEASDEDKKNFIRFESIVEKLEAEKLYFENILDRLKDQHGKEITTIEESYRRQIEIMTQGTERLEKRLRQDLELTEADYEAKIQKLREEQESLKIAHGEEIENLKREYIKSIQEIRDQQHRNIELVQNEYVETIENMSKAKDIERQTVSNATTQTANLNDALKLIKVTMTEIGELKVKLDNINGEKDRAKELVLKQQTEELKDLKDYLKKQHEAMEADREDLMEATRRLNGGALKLISEFDRHVKENIEAEDRLKNREQKLMREKELLDGQIQWERDHIQAMRETWIREQERQAKQLTDERNSIAAERSRLETVQKLKLNDNDTAKTELEAALSTVRDASNLAKRERQKWRERLNELEVQKQQIRDKENSLTMRAKELEDLTQSALEKRDEGLRALKEARYLDEQHKAFLNQLQAQSEALAQRENKVAAEKLALASEQILQPNEQSLGNFQSIRLVIDHIFRERLALRIGQIDKPEKDVGKASGPLNYTGDQQSYHPSQFNALPDSQMTTTHFKDIVDPRLILLKLGLDNELDVSNDCLGTMQCVVQQTQLLNYEL